MERPCYCGYNRSGLNSPRQDLGTKAVGCRDICNVVCGGGVTRTFRSCTAVCARMAGPGFLWCEGICLSISGLGCLFGCDNICKPFD